MEWRSLDGVELTADEVEKFGWGRIDSREKVEESWWGRIDSR